MSSYVDRERARHEFRKFIIDLLASQARHVACYDDDALPVAPIEVLRGEMLTVFLEKNSQHVCYRDALSTVLRGQPMFSLSAQRWKDLAAWRPAKLATNEPRDWIDAE
jgi:hypothetical protein